MLDEYFVYIDEAGDEGFGKLRSASSNGQSKWLMLGCIVVSKENDGKLPKWRNSILECFPHKRRRDLHFHKLKHEQKVATCRMMADFPFGACVVCSDKQSLLDLDAKLLSVYKQKGHLYNYLVRYLLERVTEKCALKSKRAGRLCKVHVTFSKRGGTDYQVMRDYLFFMRDGREKLPPVRSINWDVLNPEDVRVEDHSQRAGLQLADVVTSATYSGLETNLYGDCEPRYAKLLKARFLVTSGKIENSGITIMPRSALRQPHVSKFFDDL